MTNKKVTDKKTVIMSVRFSMSNAGRVRAAAKADRRKPTEFLELAILDAADSKLKEVAARSNS